jgi:hypothetical protein
MLFAFEALAPEMLGAEVFGAEALGTALGAEALMGLGAEALGAGAVGGAEAALGADAMAANAAAGGAGAGGAGINAAQVAAQQNAAMQLANPGITGIPEAVMSPAQQAYQAASSASVSPGITPGTQALPAYTNNFLPYSFESSLVPAEASAINTSGGIASPALAAPPPSPPMGLEMPGAYSPGNIQGADPNFFNPSATVAPGQGPLPSPQYQLNAPNASQGLRLGSSLESSITAPQMTSVLQPPSALEAGMDKAIKFAEKNPFTAMTGAYMGASALGLLNPSGATFNNTPYNGPLSKIRLSPDFKGTFANPSNFRYKGYAAGGGIMGAEDYDIPVGYDEGGPVALPLPSRTMRSSDAFQVPGQPQDPSQFAAADAYNDILRNRVIADTSTNRLNDANLGYYQATPNELANMAGNTKFGFSSTMAQKELASRSNEGEFAVPGYGDLGQFAGGGNDNYASKFGGSASFNSPKDDNPYNVDAFAKGGSLSDSIAQYQKMLSGQPQAAPAASHDVGIYYDQDPDTRYQDALTAAQIRQAKVNQRAYVSPPVAKRPTPMGKLNMPTSAKSKDSSSGDVEAYKGGIMSSSLGGYAAGGNPRLLKGPGDGMSDNIPATINGRQPARLADGEFVVPADVVSHLGNGSTDAGAKHLHAMMDKVRKARTGNPKQGKQINAKKYMPK